MRVKCLVRKHSIITLAGLIVFVMILESICSSSGHSRWGSSSMYRLHGGDLVRSEQTQRDNAFTMDAGIHTISFISRRS